MTAYGDILWRPDPARSTHMARFATFVGERVGRDLSRFPDLHAWSVAETAEFWGLAAEFTGVKFMTPPTATYQPPPSGKMRGAEWFAGAQLNYAENLLVGPERPAVLTSVAEGGAKRTYSLTALRRDVARCAAALKKAGVGPGDRVAGVVANIPEAIIAMLGTATLGAIWASCSPDFGAPGITERFTQIEPKVVFFTKSYAYGGKRFDVGIDAVLANLPTVQQAVTISHLGEPATWDEFLSSGTAPLDFAPRSFLDPLFILFSSGTTGTPKCIVHSVGGTLLQHKKELLLHSDIGPGSRLLYFTTCGWMMWNWMASALATGSDLVLFEGSPASPDLGVLWRTLAAEKVTAFGTSPKFIASCISAGTVPAEHLEGHVPRTVLTTGAPLLPEQFAWIYERLGQSVHLASISGGTDIVSCFMLGTPLLPVRAGEIQYAGLGMAIDAWDAGGQPVRGAKGELVCTRPFPAMPIGFWRDHDGEKYRRAYFDHYPSSSGEVWRHGDFVEITASGGVIVFGRSDATLNPGGVRIGTAEIYRQMEKVPEVADALAIGRRVNGDEDIVLFVKLVRGAALSAELAQKIKTTIRTGLTPRHVPAAIIAIDDIPYTRSGKKVELAVTQALHGEAVTNLNAMVNPESMNAFLALGKEWAKGLR